MSAAPVQRLPSDRAFGLGAGGLLAVVAAVAWLGFGRPLPVLSGVALSLIAVALAAPGLLLPLNRIWAWFAGRLAPVTNGLVLGLFYYLVVLPIGLLMRLFGSDPMARRASEGDESLWTTVDRQATPESFKDLF